MSKPELSRCVLTTGVLCVSLLLLSTEGRSEHPPPSCSPLPEQGPTNTVSLYVAKALDAAGIVCVRVINGFNERIETRGTTLQKWEDGKLWGLWGQGFQELKSKQPSAGGILPGSIGSVLMPPLRIADMRLPLSGQPAPPGRYQVCFSYLPPDQEKYQEVCSEEFSLP